MINSITKKIYSFSLNITGFLVVIIIWSIFARGLNPLILPSPRETVLALKELLSSGKLTISLLITLRRTFAGYILAILMGVLCALILNKYRVIRKIIRPLITVIQTTPPVIWIALAVIWFGIAEDLTPIFLIFIVTFPVIFINVAEGLENIDKELIEMARVYFCSDKQIFFHIYIPSLVPYLASALSIGFAFAWKATIFAEFIGSSSGVGFALSMANSNLQTDILFAWTVVLVGLMLAMEYLLIRPLQRKVTEWRRK